MRNFKEQDYYELLDISPHAAGDEIEEAYRRALKLYHAESNVTYALFQRDELRVIRRRIEEAFQVLSNPERRQQYDQDRKRQGAIVEEVLEPNIKDQQQFSLPQAPNLNLVEKSVLPEEPLVPEKIETTSTPTTLPPAVDSTTIDSDIEVTGHLIKASRETKGLSLEKLADVTKINIYYLRNIESENFSELPAAVYIRGYVQLIAKQVGLDPERLSKGYLNRIQNKKSSG